MNKTTRMRQLVEGREILVAPGAYDALTAKLVERAGFQALYMTGAGISYTLMGMPDLGLVTYSEMVERAGRMAEATDLPILADGDNGYGNALNVQRTVRGFERAGIAAIQLEDQQAPKRCGHLEGKRLIPMGEMRGKLKAALDARTDPDFLIVARTDARSVSGLEEAIERAQAYAEVGADVIFVESPRSEAELKTVAGAVHRPLLANMVENGLTPLLSAVELQALGYGIVIFPGALTRFIARQAQGFLERLRDRGTTRDLLGEMLDFRELNSLLGLEQFKALDARYGEQ
jgi:carboxyvinyl-carboxyphosphonate phosphorylmutase